MNYPEDYPRVGDVIDVFIERIILDERKIKLSQRPPGRIPEKTAVDGGGPSPREGEAPAEPR
jgi:hypothetical protein